MKFGESVATITTIDSITSLAKSTTNTKLVLPLFYCLLFRFQSLFLYLCVFITLIINIIIFIIISNLILVILASFLCLGKPALLSP